MSLNIAELDSHCCPVSPLRPRPTASRLFPNGTVDRSSHCWTRLFIIDSFKLKVVYDRESTNLEPDSNLELSVGFIIGGRYQIKGMLDKTSFCRVYKCDDLLSNHGCCLKVVENQKVLFDQSIEEIKMLKLIQTNCDTEEFNIMKLYDYFYWREH